MLKRLSLLAACLVLTGCSGQAAPKAGPSPSVTAEPTPSPTVDPYPALCRAIATAHVQVLFTKPLDPIGIGGSSDCQFSAAGGDALKVFLRVDDGDKTLFDHLGDHPYGTFTALALPGGQAKWGYRDGDLPSVVDARKGVFSCALLLPGDTTVLAPVKGSGKAAAALMAARLLPICADALAAR